MSIFWSIFISSITLLMIIASVVLLKKTSNIPPDEPFDGHVWDDDVEELNNPLPRWWLLLFYITLIFAVVYFLLYPGLGSFKGYFEWNQAKAYQAEVEEANTKQAALFAQYKNLSISELTANKAAMETGRRLFNNHCAGCHASDGGGAPGFPNLRDEDWLYGDSEASIKQTIRDGRTGMMPPMESQLTEQELSHVLAFILPEDKNTKNVSNDQTLIANTFKQKCGSCHGDEGYGNTTMGAPNLRDNIWLHSRDKNDIIQLIKHGKQNKMPAHNEILSEEKIHVLTGYVKRLSS